MSPRCHAMYGGCHQMVVGVTGMSPRKTQESEPNGVCGARCPWPKGAVSWRGLLAHWLRSPCAIGAAAR